MEIKFKNTKGFSFEKETMKEEKQETICTEVAELVTELMNAATSFHKLHLKVSGLGSYAQHKALNEIYDALPGYADDLAESFQGAKGEILKYVEMTPKVLNSKEEALMYAQQLKDMITELQGKLPYSEIINDLDITKSGLNSLLYKLKFLS